MILYPGLFLAPKCALILRWYMRMVAWGTISNSWSQFSDSMWALWIYKTHLPGVHHTYYHALLYSGTKHVVFEFPTLASHLYITICSDTLAVLPLLLSSSRSLPTSAPSSQTDSLHYKPPSKCISSLARFSPFFLTSSFHPPFHRICLIHLLFLAIFLFSHPFCSQPSFSSDEVF